MKNVYIYTTIKVFKYRWTTTSVADLDLLKQKNRILMCEYSKLYVCRTVYIYKMKKKLQKIVTNTFLKSNKIFFKHTFFRGEFFEKPDPDSIKNGHIP